MHDKFEKEKVGLASNQNHSSTQKDHSANALLIVPKKKSKLR